MTTKQPSNDSYALRPREAWSALKVLLANPEDTSQVFAIVRALTGKSMLRGYQRFARTDTGQAILQENRSLLDHLSDRKALRDMPRDSLGRAYLHYVESEQITADGLVDASASDAVIDDPQMALYANRVRDMHDLWHTASGYGRDVSGEVCLLAFSVAQLKNPGLAVIALAGMLKIARENDRRIVPAAWAAFRAGCTAAWLPAQDWEALLAMPLDEVRTRLQIPAPRIYPDIVEGLAAA